MTIRTETIFTWAAPTIKFGVGALQEIGWDVAQLGMTRALVVTDRTVASTGLATEVRGLLVDAGVYAAVYDEVAIEPTDESVDRAAAHASSGGWDGLVAIGGGSVIDTAKAINLLITQSGSLLDFVAPPIGGGRTPEAPVLPLVAVPTTAGTGSEATTICVVDLLSQRIKAGISAVQLRPTMAVIDPTTTLTLGPEATASCGVDVLSHAIESYTAKSFSARPAFESPSQRAAFSGSNPISDLWCERAIQLVGQHLRQAVMNGTDLEARSGMMLASTYAGIGFGSAGTHLPHANSYPVAGQVRHYRAPGYPEMPMVPHGQAVASTAVPSFRFTYPACRDRHLRAASLLAGRPLDPDLQVEALPSALTDLFTDIGIPRGIASFGFTADDIPDLVAGTLKQQRQMSVVPRQITRGALTEIFTSSLEAR
jgi:alcohol dehydrogenase class IV